MFKNLVTTQSNYLGWRKYDFKAVLGNFCWQNRVTPYPLCEDRGWFRTTFTYSLQGKKKDIDLVIRVFGDHKRRLPGIPSWMWEELEKGEKC